MSRRTSILTLAVLLVLAIAVPVLAAGPGASSAPGKSKDKAKTPESPITLNGTIESSTDANGEAQYTLKDGGTTYTLEAGPKWFFDKGAYPLDPYVGKSVKVEGEVADGGTEVDVTSIDGTALRDPGKPPWAGGPNVVGENHPGWSQEKADRMKAKFGDCFPPGRCKDKAKGQDGAGDQPEGSESPDQSEAPDSD
jgi:hypothetical protein